jgi:dephospho-CoA kinase
MNQKKIALTGGIATGKSTVASMLAELGAVILDADKVARQVVEPGASCWQELHRLLGPDYFEPDGTLKRRLLRECIIRDSSCRSRVNAILHPSIVAAMEGEWEKSKADRPDRPVIFDIPLLYEANLAHGFDTVIVAYTSREIQIERLMKRDKLTREEAEKTLAMQLPIDLKKNEAQIVIDNSLDIEHTRRQVRALWEEGSLK